MNPIIRTMKCWDNIEKKWPRRSHTAVLVAEEITSRFFNVVGSAMPGAPFHEVVDSYEIPGRQTPRSYDENTKLTYGTAGVLPVITRSPGSSAATSPQVPSPTYRFTVCRNRVWSGGGKTTERSKSVR